MDWREEQRRANERAKKQHEENQRRQEALTRKNQEDSRRRNEEAKRLQERREDQQKADRRDRQRRDDAARDRAALERQTQAIARNASQSTPSHNTYVSSEERNNRIEYSEEIQVKPKGCFGRIFTLLVIAVAIYVAWVAFGRDKLSEMTNQITGESVTSVESSSSMAKEEVKTVKPKVSVKKAIEKYPPCTATRQDQCTQQTN